MEENVRFYVPSSSHIQGSAKTIIHHYFNYQSLNNAGLIYHRTITTVTLSSTNATKRKGKLFRQREEHFANVNAQQGFLYRQSGQHLGTQSRG